LDILASYGERHVAFGAQPGSFQLEGSRAAYRRIERDVGRVLLGRSGLDVAAALTIGARERAFARLPARQPVDGCVQALRAKRLANFDGTSDWRGVCL
jgi:hypothetical protein